MRTRADLLALQRQMAATITRPLAPGWRMQPVDEEATKALIKPNDRLSSFARLEIYNRQYWFRLLDCLYDDFPGLLAIVGPRRFLKLATAYIAKHPSRTFALRDLGCDLETFLIAEPRWAGPRHTLAVDMARFEWAQIVAFDAEALDPISLDDILDLQAGKLSLALQPCLTLLDLSYPVDKFLLGLKGSQQALRSEASNAKDAPVTLPAKKRPPLPRRARTFLAVLRQKSRLYFKRMAPGEFVIFSHLRDGSSLDDACAAALEVGDTSADQIRDWFTTWAALGWICRRG